MPKKLVNKEEKPIGKVTHYFGGISVAIVKFNRTVKVGETVKFKGASTDFEETIETMQFDHKDIKSAKKNQEVGIKVEEKTREGDKVYSVK
ncbi:MAG: hypothetical protein AAB514_01735 [Patescibacteria group bacterium]